MGEITLPYNSNEFIDAWNDWLDYKKAEFNFKYKSPQSLKAALKKLHRISEGNEQKAIQIIEEAIANGWKGFFKIKEEQSNKKINAGELLKQKYGLS